MTLDYTTLEKHIGHKLMIIEFESYCSEGHKECINLECMDCNEILIDCERLISSKVDK